MNEDMIEEIKSKAIGFGVAMDIVHEHLGNAAHQAEGKKLDVRDFILANFSLAIQHMFDSFGTEATITLVESLASVVDEEESEGTVH